MAEFKIRDKETGEIFTIREKEFTQEQQGQPQPQSQGQPMERQNILGQLLNVPAAAQRSAIMGQGYTQGAIQPSQVPTFSQATREQYPIRGENIGTISAYLATRLPLQMGAGLADVATDPAAMLGLLLGNVPAVQKGAKLVGGKVISGFKKIFRYDKVLEQAKKSKVALDCIRTTLGQAKDIALQEVKDVPAELNWTGNVSDKVVKAIQNPIYKVELTQEGGVVNTIGNLDKVKTALQDLLTTKDYVEAGNMEKRQIMQFAGRVRDTMVEAANKVGKPELAKALKNYHNFMENYEIINTKLIDKFGNALGNKMKDTFRFTAEPAVKEAWKEVGKSSPEIKDIIKSRQNRELLKVLLKVGAPIAGAGTIVGTIKKFTD